MVQRSFLCRLFASLLKDQGPMDPNDAVIQHELEMCSTAAQVVICEAGGISKFLRQSLQFATVDGYICLASDAGKARQLARSRRQLYQQQQQPPVKLNPPQYVSAAAGVFLPNTVSSTPSATKTPQFAYNSLAGMDISLSPRIIPGLSQQSDFQPSYVPTFLSQPSATRAMFQPNISSSADVQTAVHHANNYNDSGIKKVNANNACDDWVTVSKVPKSFSGIKNADKNTSGAIGELDDFSEPNVSENLSNGGELTLNEATVSDVAKQTANYKQFKNIQKTSDSDSGDESSAAESDDSLSSTSNGSVDEEDIAGDPVGDLDTFDTEVAETCATQEGLTSMALSVTAPEFIPLSFAASQPSLITSVGKSSPKMTASNRASSHSRPSSRAALTSDKQIQTDESLARELQQLKDSYKLDVAQLHQQLSQSRTQLQVSLSLTLIHVYIVSFIISFHSFI